MEIIFILLFVAVFFVIRAQKDDIKQEKKDDVTIPTTTPYTGKYTGSYKFSSSSGRLRNPNGSLRAMRRRYTR